MELRVERAGNDELTTRNGKVAVKSSGSCTIRNLHAVYPRELSQFNNLIKYSDRSWESSAGIAMDYGQDGRGCIPVLYFTASRPTLRPTKWLPGVKRLRREAGQSPPSSTEIKNSGTLPPLPYMPSWLGA
jgi:hypothetical protein